MPRGRSWLSGMGNCSLKTVFSTNPRKAELPAVHSTAEPERVCARYTPLPRLWRRESRSDLASGLTWAGLVDRSKTNCGDLGTDCLPDSTPFPEVLTTEPVA